MGNQDALAQTELDALKAALAAFARADEGAERLLRDKRRSMAESLLGIDAGQAAAQFSGAIGELHRLLVFSGLRDFVRAPDEQPLAERILSALRGNAAPAPGALLAAMLLFQAFELPLPQRLDLVPDWLLPDYVRFLAVMPQVFNHLGDAERYHGFLTEAIDLVHGYVFRDPRTALAAAVRDRFLQEAKFAQIYFNEHNLRDLYRKRAQLIEDFGFSHGARFAHRFPLRSSAAKRRLRIGVLCEHLGPQTETYFTLAYFERLPRERCILTLYVRSDSPHPLSDYARTLADACVDLPSDISAAVERIRADDLDVLLVGTNVTVSVGDLAFLSMFRLARAQVFTASSPVTTGFTTADWFVNAEENESEERALTQYTEQVYRMPGMLTRYAYHLDRDPRTISIDRGDLGVPKNAVLFMSGANYFKVVPELSATWARIMAEVPGAWLLLMPFNTNWATNYLSAPFEARILEQVANAGGDPNQVLILPPVPARADLHAVMSLADVYLDSFPFPGACSLLDPLLVGLPIVARSGHTFRSDVGAGMLRGLGLGDMAVADADAYVGRAVSLARDAALRKRARERIKSALSPVNPVFDSGSASRNMEAALVDIAARTEAIDSALLRQPPGALRSLLGRLAAALAGRGNGWFESLSDLELVRLLLVPYFDSLPGEQRHMLDVGACFGQMAQPFLARGWNADLFEPDSACEPALQALAAQYGSRVQVHALAISESREDILAYYRSATGLSGLSPSPHGATQETVQVPSTRLDEFCRNNGIEKIDLLKVDAEGWDFDVLRSHDFEALPPKIVMAEFGSEFPRQTSDAVASAIATMRRHGYEALVFSYEDDGNFKLQIWKYRLIALTLGTPVPRRDGHIGGNIVFYRADDTVLLACAVRLLLGFLPACERAPFLPA